VKVLADQDSLTAIDEANPSRPATLIPEVMTRVESHTATDVPRSGRRAGDEPGATDGLFAQERRHPRRSGSTARSATSTTCGCMGGMNGSASGIFL